MKNNSSFSVRRVLFIFLFGLSFITLLSISMLWIYTEIKQTKEASVKLEKNVLIKQELEIKAQAKMAAEYVEAIIENRNRIPVKQAQDLALSLLEKIRFGYAGYVFVNTFDGQALIFDGKKVEGIQSIKEIRDPEGKNLYLMEYGATLKPQGGFMRYYFKKMNQEIPQPKLAYVVGEPHWKWMIGAGDYTIDAKKQAQTMSESLAEKLKIKVLLIFLIFIVMSIAAFFISNFLSNVFAKQIRLFLDHFEQSNGNKINQDFFKTKEFKKLAGDIQKIENEKQTTENKLKETVKNTEHEVKIRTQELETKNKELERYNNLFIDREFRIKELRDEIKLLKAKLKEYELKG